MMKSHLRWIIPIVLLLAIVGGILALRLYRKLTGSFEVVTAGNGSSVVVTPAATTVSAETNAQVRARLEQVGLQSDGPLGSTGINEHIRRLEAGEVSAETLLQYADNLAQITRFTAENGAEIPVSFFDFQSEMMRESKMDEYTVAYRHNLEGGDAYLLLLAKAYERFANFKAKDTSGEDTAVDAALDLLYLTDEYDRGLSEPPDPQDGDAVHAANSAKLTIWQSLIAGTSRTNPLTGKPIFSHGLYGHYSVAEMWRHAQGEDLSISEVWVLSGFSPEFVGIPENNNQIEHMSISTILQAVLGESVIVLDGIEEEKVIKGDADSREARADMALNNAIHRTIVERFDRDGFDAVETLRCTLKGNC